VTTAADLRWYVHRASRMSPAETAVRVRDSVRQQVWRTRQVRPGADAGRVETRSDRRFTTVLAPAAGLALPPERCAAVIAEADRLLTGRSEVLGARRDDLDDPDWFHDPITGRRAPSERYAFGIRFRSEAETGNVKQVWEVSRHQHLTVLATAFYLTGDARYAQAVATQLRSWWRRNPFLSGVHWTSGIEIALRLVAWVWIRRLLDGWDGVHALFDDNDDALRQLAWHQQYLAAFRSVGSSANNHVIAEAAGQLVASCAMPWFARSAQWRTDAAELLTRSADANTFASGVNRELATDYHLFVAELLLLAAVESDCRGLPLADSVWNAIGRMIDVAAAVLDASGGAPRQGDADDGRALVVDDRAASRWDGLLDIGARLFGAPPWWPEHTSTVGSRLLGSLATRPPVARPERAALRPARFPDAGLALLRTRPDDPRPELWCRADGGPHGFLSTAAHGHADALSIEVRHGGVEIFVDPGTYCYHGEAAWRQYFRSTLAHNTVELAGRDQSRSGGPFMWVRHAQTQVLEVVVDGDGEIESWTAQHDGYADLSPPAIHRRTVRLDRDARRLEIVDEIDTTGAHALQLAFHLGCDVSVRPATTDASVFALAWPTAAGCATATLVLADALEWRVVRGGLDPVLGWYSPSFGVKQPTTTLVGTGTSVETARRLHTELAFEDAEARPHAREASGAASTVPGRVEEGELASPTPES
jgi:hypothetical protein